MAQDRFEEAISELNIAIEMNPNHALAINARGYAQASPQSKPICSWICLAHGDFES